MNENLIKYSLNEAIKNPYWREYYETAPSEYCKRYIQLKFYFSEYLGNIPDYDEFKAACDRLENCFTKKDWQHLLKHCANNPRRTYYRNKLQQAEN